MLVAHFDDSLQRALWSAIRGAAARRGVATLAFLGHGLDSPDPAEATANIAYRMVGPGVVDGLIVFTNNLATFSGPEPVAALIRASGVPTVSMGVALEGVPSVMVPGAPAMTALVDHLVTVHGLKRFGLVTGPSDHPESKERETAVRAALERHGCPLGPRMTVDAGFSREKGREAAGALLAAGPRPEAVICLSDHMAVGVSEGLRRHGLRVPQDVVVTGFDDLEESQWRHPALTTVRQPLEAMAEWAVTHLLELLSGGTPRSVSLPGELSLRSSCGCAVPEVGPAEAEHYRVEVERGLDKAERFTRIRQMGARLLGTFRLESLAREWEATTAALGLAESALILLDDTPQARHIRWFARGGLQEHRFPAPELFPPGFAPPDRADWVLVPLVYQREPLGYLLLRSDREDPHVYETLRDQVSSAVKATLLMEASRSHENLLEREVQEIGNRTMQAIGQDIHDDLCQYLAGIAMLVSVLAEKTPEADRAPVTEIGHLLEGALDRARKYARSLYPPGLEEHGLGPAVKDLVESLPVTASGVQISLQADPDLGPLDPRAALQIYRILQESLGNAIRHSGGDLVMVRLSRRADGLEAEVRDFGRGLPHPAPGRGMGLKILRYRADSIGATLTFQHLDPGLAVTCFYPLPEANRG